MAGMRQSTVDIIASRLERQNNSAYDRKPLIEYCKNDWATIPEHTHIRTTSRYSDGSPLDDIEDVIERAWEVVKGPKFRRLLFLITASIVSFWMLWTTYLNMLVKQEKAVWTSLSGTNNPKSGVWGKSMRARFPGLKQVETLDSQFMPSPFETPKEGESSARRLIFIGDIHGTMDELELLLQKAKYDPKSDHLVTTGDMIDKGPKSLEVVDYLMQQNASCVRGNHEDRVLLLAKGVHSSTVRNEQHLEKNVEEKEKGKISATNIRERDLATKLSQDQISYLDACPLILRVGETMQHGSIVVAHGGLVPMLELENQDPATVMNMRVLNMNTHVPSRNQERSGCVPWADLWNSYQRQVPAQRKLSRKKNESDFKHMTVIYGHDSKRGLQMKSWTRGLDSACVKGGKLTALILSDGGKEELVQVDCKNYRPKLTSVEEANDY